MSLEWVKKGIKWILQEKAGPLYPALRPFTETKPFLSRFHKSIQSHLQKYFQHANFVETWGYQTLNPRRARQSAIMFSALKTPQLPTWLTTGEISLKSLQIFFVFSLSPLPFTITIQKCKKTEHITLTQSLPSFGEKIIYPWSHTDEKVKFI